MGASLIIALGAAGLALLVFGERLGLPAAWAASGVIGVLAFQIIGLALASTTSRLPVFLRGDGKGGIWRAASTAAGVLVLMSITDPGLKRFEIDKIMAFLSAFVPVLVLAPAPWSDLAARHMDARRMLAIITALSALLAVFMAWGPVRSDIIRIMGWQDSTTELAMLAVAGLLAILGGLSGVLRITGALMLMLAFLCLMPFGIDLAQALPPFATVETISGSGQRIVDMARAAMGGGLLTPHAGTMLLGFLAGLIVRIAGPAQPHPGPRGLAILLGIMLALGFLGADFIARMQLDGVILPMLTRISPEAWPLFVFEPALEGWLSVCGRVPQDAVDVAQACRTAGAPPAAQLAILPQLAFPALAASANWPLLLGVIWSLAIPLLAMLAIGGLIHMAASGLSEHLVHRFFHPRGLRAWRLAMARLIVLAILGALGATDAPAMLTDEKLQRVLATGLAILGAVSLASIALRALIAMLVARLRKVRGAHPALPVAAE